MLTQSELKCLLHYDPKTGMFTRIFKSSNNVKIGDIAGGIHNKGYISISVLGKVYLAHRLAWLYIYGEFPKEQIDHVNGVRVDNRIINLRECNQYQNNQNLICRKNVTSKYIGVSWDEKRNKWRATIYVNGRQKYLGRFATELEAFNAYLNAKLKFHSFNPTPR
jgi:hypothetical protein